MNHFTFVAKVTKDPKTGMSSKGEPYCFVGTGISQGKVYNSDEWKPTIWIDLKFFNNRFGLVDKAASLVKGDRVVVSGRLELTEDKEQGRTQLELSPHSLELVANATRPKPSASVAAPPSEDEIPF